MYRIRFQSAHKLLDLENHYLDWHLLTLKKERTYPGGTAGMFAGRSGKVPSANGMFFMAATWRAARRKFSSIARYFVVRLFRAAMCIRENMGLGNVRNCELLSVAFFTKF